VGPAVAQASGTVEGAGFVLAANPEFLRDSSAEDDARWPWMTVVGARSRRVGERLAALLQPFGGELRVFDKPETAELVKCVHNLYNATKISFWNEMWLVARALHLDPDDIASTVSRSAEGSLNPAYGIRGGAPFAGRCLPKDTDGFLAFARELGLPMPLLDSVVGVNRHLTERVEGELEALSRGPGRVLDLRDAERRHAVPAERRDSVATDREFVQDRPTGYDSPAPDGFGRDGGPGWDGGHAVPGARDPLSGDLPTVGPAGRDPFTGGFGMDDRPYDGRDRRRDERW
jgi:hypothetical protein